MCATLAVALLGPLWWLLAQLGPRIPRLLPLSGDDVRLCTRALSRACAQQALANPDPARARARAQLSPLRRHRGIRAPLVITLAPGAAPGPVPE